MPIVLLFPSKITHRCRLWSPGAAVRFLIDILVLSTLYKLEDLTLPRRREGEPVRVMLSLDPFGLIDGSRQAGI